MDCVKYMSGIMVKNPLPVGGFLWKPRRVTRVSSKSCRDFFQNLSSFQNLSRFLPINLSSFQKVSGFLPKLVEISSKACRASKKCRDFFQKVSRFLPKPAELLKHNVYNHCRGITLIDYLWKTSGHVGSFHLQCFVIVIKTNQNNRLNIT